MSHRRRDVPGGLGLNLGLRVGNTQLGGGGLPTLFNWRPVDGQALPSGTFTRASVKQEFDGTDFTELASGAIPENSAAVGSGAQGYFPEPAATNQLTSTDMETWTQTRVNNTDLGVGSLGLPDYEVDAETATGNHNTSRNADTGAAGSGYAIAKEGTGRYMNIRRSGAGSWATFDTQTGTVTDQGGGASLGTPFVEDLGNSFYKCIVPTDETNAFFAIAISDSATPGTSLPSFTGANETILVNHAQYEHTTYTTSPVLASGSLTTRAADVLDTDVTIASAFGALLDITLPLVIASGDTITLLGPDATAEDIIRVDESFNVIMDDGGTPATIGTSSAGARIKVSYGRDGTGRSGSLDGATVVTGDAPGAGHEGDTFQLGAANSVNQSRCIHHSTTIYSIRPSDSQLESLSS